MSVILNEYEYEITESYDNIGNSVEVTVEDELETAISLNRFLECERTYSPKDIEKLLYMRKQFGLVDKVIQELYEAYYDLVFYGNKDERWFWESFNLSQNELGLILL